MRNAVLLTMLGIFSSAQADEQLVRVLLSARLCVQQLQMRAAISNNRALKRAGEDVEPLDGYRKKIADAKQAIVDAGIKPMSCGDTTVKRIARCLPEAGDGYQVGYPEDPKCEKPAVQRYLKADSQ